MTKLSKYDVVARCKTVHGNRYDYSKLCYINHSTPFIVICPDHGEFRKSLGNHTILKQGCPECSRLLKTQSLDDFIIKSHKKFDNKYDYSQVNYVNALTKVTILCPTHGKFSQRPSEHLISKHGCPHCAGNIKHTAAEFITMGNITHNNYYGYSDVKYTNNRSAVDIICPIHGVFQQTPYAHINRKQGCPTCAGNIPYTTNSFINVAAAIHQNKYDYSKFKYVNSHSKSIIICPTHGEFTQRPNSHQQGRGCPTCGFVKAMKSQSETDIFEYVHNIYPTAIRSDRKIISPKELDIVIPEIKFAIEYCGVYWHGEKLVGPSAKTKHLDKLITTNDSGYDLITIFENEWMHNHTATCSNVLYRIGPPINITNIDIRSISDHIAKEFLSEHSLCDVTGNDHYGAYDGARLIAVMGFRSLTYNICDGKFELTNYATDGTNYTGIATILFSAFVDDYSPRRVITYENRRWPDRDFYDNLKFTIIETLPPSYYFREKGKISLHHQSTLPSHMSWADMTNAGYDRIWDCGTNVYEWIYGDYSY